MTLANIGVIGLGVMGRNLVLNMERNGFTVAVFNKTTAKMHEFIQGDAAGKRIVGYETLADLVKGLERPRRILLMVTAGAAVDAVIAELKPLLEPGDILIDGGNSYFLDTERRSRELEASGLWFVGMGVSGGEEGALWGPSIMPGGSPEAWQALAPILQAIAARAEPRDFSVARFACVAGCCHILVFIAGATTTGPAKDRYRVVRASSAIPAAIFAITLAVAGAMRKASPH